MINEHKISPYKPEQGIIVYKKGSDFYLESHDIKVNDDGKYSWGEGKPLHVDVMVEIAKSFGTKKLDSGFSKGVLPQNLILLNQGYTHSIIMWHTKAQQRMMHFHKDLKIKSGLIHCPPMLFAVSNRTLYVFALASNNRPTGKTKLLKAPFFNQYESGSVCMGNTRESKKKPTIQEEILRWERRYFGSVFTHLIDTKVINKQTNLSILLNSLSGKNKVFPIKELVPADTKTVDTLIKKISN